MNYATLDATTAPEREIDARLYTLYALTPDEIKLVNPPQAE
jgi:hypothetical protein